MSAAASSAARCTSAATVPAHRAASARASPVPSGPVPPALCSSSLGPRRSTPAPSSQLAPSSPPRAVPHSTGALAPPPPVDPRRRDLGQCAELLQPAPPPGKSGARGPAPPPCLATSSSRPPFSCGPIDQWAPLVNPVNLLFL